MTYGKTDKRSSFFHWSDCRIFSEHLCRKFRSSREMSLSVSAPFPSRGKIRNLGSERSFSVRLNVLLFRALCNFARVYICRRRISNQILKQTHVKAIYTVSTGKMPCVCRNIIYGAFKIDFTNDFSEHEGWNSVDSIEWPAPSPSNTNRILCAVGTQCVLYKTNVRLFLSDLHKVSAE